MKRHDIDIGGMIVYWSLGWTNRQALNGKLAALRLDKHTPKPRTDPHVLRQALGDLYGSRTTIIRPLRDRSGFAVVKEERGEDRNTYKHTLAVRAENGVVTCDDPAEDVRKIQEKFDDLSALLSPAVVSAAVVDILTNVLGATSLREHGGVYFVPEWSLARLGAIVEAVESSCVPEADGKRQSTVYTIQTVKDEKCIAAVRDAIMTEIGKQIETIDAEISGGTLGERALNSRKEDALRMRRKLGMYEKELGVTMQALAEQIDRVKEAAALAAITAAAKAAGAESNPYSGVDVGAVFAGVRPAGGGA